MNSDKYSAPIITELQTVENTTEETPTPTTTVIAAVAETVDISSNESFWREKVDNHFRYLCGEIGFRTPEDRVTEMISFMQQTGRMLKYSYPEVEDCVLYLIQKLRNSPTASADGRFFRYIKGTENKYPPEAAGQYRIFMTWCISIADSWPTRVKRANVTDIESLTKNMPDTARANLNHFVRKMANYAIK